MIPNASAVAGRFGIPIIRVEELTSTQDLARVLAATGAPEGAVVVARRQTQGRGRLGRPWVSPAGGLWASVLLRPGPGVAPGALSLAVGVAAAEAIETAAGISAAIQWPNDVVVAGRKVAGVLLETAGDAVIAGVGVNADLAACDLPPDLAGRAGTLREAAGRPVSLDALLDALVARLAAWSHAARSRPHVVVEAWRARDAIAGRPVVVVTPSGDLLGTAEGVDADGALRLRTADGAIRRVLAGDVQLRVPGAGARA